jgi:antirestriction protein
MIWKSGDKITKFADWKLTISDYGQLSMDKGSENLYLALIVYKDDETQPMELQIYTKENHKGLKDFSNQIIKKFAKGGEVGSEHEFVVTFQNSETGKLLKLNVLGTDEKNAIENAYMESEFNEPYEVYSVKKFAKGGEVSQYIDGLSKQEVLSKSIVYDNGGESYDRYTIFTPDGSVYGMSETAEGFNQYIGDSSEIEKGKHLGRKLRSVPKGIQSAVLDRMLDDEQMFAKGGKLSKEDALQKAIDIGVDFDKDFHAQSVGNELAELAKESGYKKSQSSSGSTGRAFFFHLQKIYNAKVYANHKQTMRNAPFDENTYPKGTEFAKGGEVEKPLSYYKYETPKVKIAWKGKIQPLGMFKSAEEAMMVIEKKSNGIKSEINEYSIVTPDKTIHLGKEYAIRYAKGGMMNANKHFRLRGLEFLKDDLAQLQQAVQDNNQEEIQKFFSYWGQHLEMLKTTNNERMFSFLQDDLMKLENDIEEKNQEEIEKFFSYWGYHLESLKYAKGGTIKKSLAEFKNKVGASKYREATRGVDIKADLQIPALKKGRRVVTTKGKTSNQYGTFKNKVGSVYYENRPNHYDVNQPSEKRKIKLADGGQANSWFNIGVGKNGLEKIKNYSKENPKVLYLVTDDNYSNIGSFYLLNGIFAKKTVANPNYDFLRNKMRLTPKSDVIYKMKELGNPQGYYAQGGTFADGGVLEGAKIYVADLAEYNDGRLVGKWLDLSDYSDASELMGAIQEMLDEQTAKDKSGEVHEEWAVHDFEGFPRSFYSEYMGEKDFEKLYQIADVANDRGIPIDVLMEAVADFGADEDQIEEIADAYYGSVSTNFGNEFKDFAYEYIDSVGGFEGVSNADFYFDYDSFGSDARMDYTDEELEEYGYDELDDTELGERLVDEMGGVDQLGQKTIEMYFDYDKFGRDLEHDFISVKGDDGDYYFFNRNW